MMSDDLIYRSVLKEHIGSYAGMFTDELGFVVSLEAVLRGIDFVEAVDAVEVVHGKWEKVIPTKSAAKWSTKVSCSICHKAGFERYDFCPNCGADMRERKKNNE